MQATSAVLLVGARREWRAADAPARAFALRRDTLAQLAVSGTCLGAHFGLWVAGLQSTSLSHSLLLVSCTPLFLAFGASALGFAVSRGELAGAALSVAGVALVAFDKQTTNLERVTWQGDVLSLGAAVAIIGYMHIGAELRRPCLCSVRVPVTAMSAAFLSVAAVVVGEPTSASSASRRLRVGARVAAFAAPPSVRCGHIPRPRPGLDRAHRVQRRVATRHAARREHGAHARTRVGLGSAILGARMRRARRRSGRRRGGVRGGDGDRRVRADTRRGA